jgi:uncharacterized protein YjbJ (UPF0337 family)
MPGTRPSHVLFGTTRLGRSRSRKFREEWVRFREPSRGTSRTAITLAVLPGAQDLEALKWIGNRIEGNWREVKGKVKQKWGQLTDDDLSRINRRCDQLEGKIQQRYGLAKDLVRKDVDDWLNAHP